MSISTEISRLQTAKANIKTAIEGKGVSVPSATTLSGYSSLVDQIQQGITPSGSISITANGTYDVTSKASAVVNVPSSEQHSHSVSFNISSMPSGLITMVATDPIFLAHRADDNAVLTIIRTDEGFSAQAINYAMVSNHQFVRGDGSYTAYGCLNGYSTSESTSNFQCDIIRTQLASTKQIMNTFGLYIDENGNLRSNNISNRRVYGNYTATLTW